MLHRMMDVVGAYMRMHYVVVELHQMMVVQYRVLVRQIVMNKALSLNWQIALNICRSVAAI